MQNFLLFINYKKDQISILEQSDEIKFIENELLFLLFNGHLLNESSLCSELAITAESSTIELLENAYQKWGIDFLKKLEGTFTLVIHDKKEKHVYIAKDKIGVQPLYFTQTKDAFVVGTHLRNFKKIDNLELTVDPSSLANYLQFGFVLQPNSIFKGCHKVRSGAYIYHNLQQKQSESKHYWKLESSYEKKKLLISEEEVVEHAHELLQKSLSQNVQNSDYGLSLSGGYDSSTLTAIAQAQSNKKVDTFTIGFHENAINEAPYAKEIAKHLGTNHHEHYFTAEDALDLIPKMSQVYDEPFADHASSPTMLTSQLLKKNNIKNLIAGDGGDEVFATAEDVHLFERLQKTPAPFKNLIAKPLTALDLNKIPYLRDYNNLPKKFNKLIQILAAEDIPQMILARNTLFLEQELKLQIKGYVEPISTSFEEIEFNGYSECVDQIIGTYFKTTMIDGELVKSYSAMNSNNIRLSTPFLESGLIDYMAQIPSSIKIKEGIKKYILKEISYKYIPKKLIERPKCGFDIPFSSWMKNELKDILYAQINEERLTKDNIFYTSSILKIRDQFYAGHTAYKYKLWRIFIFQLWYQKIKG
jgi:asparagine synthase (glutamine-hydrolysing)